MIYLYRVYQVLVMIPLVVVFTIITALVTAVGSLLGGGRWWGYYPAKIWAKLFCWLTFVSVKVKGRENIEKTTSYVFISNHQGAYDIFAIYAFLGHNFKWMMKKSLEKIPFVGYACKKAGQVFVDSSSPAAIRATMKEAKARLQGGMSIVVFPEGTRSKNGRMRSFKRGAYQLSSEFKLPLVPITIDGAYDILPKNARLPRWGHITMTIHKPVACPETNEDIQAVMDETFSTIQSALPEKNR